MEVDVPSAFMTTETLKTLAGQVAVVLMATQVVRSALPWVSTYWLRLIASVAGIAVHAAVAPPWGGGPTTYVLTLVNGTVVALAAMKVAETLKGDKR